MKNFKNFRMALVSIVLLLPLGLIQAGDCDAFENDRLLSMLGEEALQLEVNLSGALLGMANDAIADELGSDANQIEGIQVMIFNVKKLDGNNQSQKLGRVNDAIQEMTSRLSRSGWDRIARVREEGTNLSVMARSKDSQFLSGLAVLGTDDDEGTAMFVSICGLIDVNALEQIGDEFDLNIPNMN